MLPQGARERCRSRHCINVTVGVGTTRKSGHESIPWLGAVPAQTSFNLNTGEFS